jgi:hypothetical protein
MIRAVIATGYFAVIVFRGPILGIIYGLGIFGLGVAKAIRISRTAVVTPDKTLFLLFFIFYSILMNTYNRLYMISTWVTKLRVIGQQSLK